MRLIGTLTDEQKALNFSLFLHQQGIENHIEVQKDTDWGSSDYGTNTCQIWIKEEDQLEEALNWYQTYLENPQDPIFTQAKSRLFAMKQPNEQTLSSQTSDDEDAIQEPVSAWAKQPMGILTRILLAICCGLFFFIQLWTSSKDIPSGFSNLLFTSSIERELLYDYPYKYQLINQLINLYGYEALKNPEELPKEGMYLIQKINQTPFWQGLYPLIQKYSWSDVKQVIAQTPMFEKIQQGEIWRLFSPALLHSDIFHLFFNMIWLIVLGKQIEQRMSGWRYLLFILLTGIFSNTSQYLISGPNFIGFSGVLCAMIAFVWMRQRHAPWEGYQLDRMTIIFISLFILSMAVLQLIFFFVETTTETTVSSGLANTAHLSGALAGLILGKLNFFSWRHT